MNVLEIRQLCLNLPYVLEDFPFDEETLVFKVMGKMFLLVDLVSHPLMVSLKAVPEEVVRLRESYSFVLPAYHLNKKYWISLIIDEYTPIKLVKKLIEDSYFEVVKKLPKYKQEMIYNEIKYERR
jgi:predicted DNA-binding protein (MmcQ/YjbR family)